MARVLSVSLSKSHTFSKNKQESIFLLKGLGIDGDAHIGETVKHRSRVKTDPSQPNLRQVHLLHSELFTELNDKGFSVKAGDIGENITTQGIDLLALPRGAKLQIGEALIEVTGVRNPCSQLDTFQDGLMQATLDRDAEGNLVRKAGIMSIVLKSGEVKLGDDIKIELPPEPFEKLERV